MVLLVLPSLLLLSCGLYGIISSKRDAAGETDTIIIIPIVQLGKPRDKEIKSFAQAHTARKKQSWNLSKGICLQSLQS